MLGVRKAFPAHASLLEVLQQALGMGSGSDAPAAAASGASLTAPPVAGSSSSSGSSSGSDSGSSSSSSTPGAPLPIAHSNVTCLLPLMGKLYTGRGADAQGLVQQLRLQLKGWSAQKQPTGVMAAVCLVAGAGMGKSSLGLDVGWQMAKAGACPGGGWILVVCVLSRR